MLKSTYRVKSRPDRHQEHASHKKFQDAGSKAEYKQTESAQEQSDNRDHGGLVAPVHTDLPNKASDWGLGVSIVWCSVPVDP